MHPELISTRMMDGQAFEVSQESGEVVAVDFLPDAFDGEDLMTDLVESLSWDLGISDLRQFASVG